MRIRAKVTKEQLVEWAKSFELLDRGEEVDLVIDPSPGKGHGTVFLVCEGDEPPGSEMFAEVEESPLVKNRRPGGR